MKTIGSLFESALRNKTRFQSTKGPLSLEQLWEVPLRSKDGFDLNAVAKSVAAELKAASEESFVESTKNPARGRIEATLEIVKHVIQTKLDEENEAQTRAERKAERDKLLEALSKKQDAAIDSLSEREIKKRLEALSA